MDSSKLLIIVLVFMLLNKLTKEGFSTICSNNTTCGRQCKNSCAGNQKDFNCEMNCENDCFRQKMGCD
jgi:hypothetical protein